MAALDMTSAVDRVRLNIADYGDIQAIPDATIQYSIDANDGNEAAATRQCAGWVLGVYVHSCDERLDRIQRTSSQEFNNYLVYLKNVINGTLGNNSFGGIYAAGIDKQDVLDNINDTSVVHNPLPLHRRHCEL